MAECRNQIRAERLAKEPEHHYNVYQFILLLA